MHGPPLETHDTTGPNPYCVAADASDYMVPLGHSMTFGVTGAGKYVPPGSRRQEEEGARTVHGYRETPIADYKNKIYGFLLNEQKLPPESIQADLMGAKSFSIGRDTEFLCQNIRFFTNHIKNPNDPVNTRQLTITDAGCGCAGDSMQFLVAEYRDPAKQDTPPERIFSKVTGIEIHRGRKEMAEANFRTVETAYETKGKVQWNVILGNYKDVMHSLRQDIVYIDPPWLGRSGEAMVHEEVFMWLDDNETQDETLGVDGIIKLLVDQNQSMQGDDEQNRTRMLIVKTPPHWRCKMLYRTRNTPGVFKGIRITAQKYDYWMFFLCKIDSDAIALIKCKYTKIEGFQSWQQQEAKLKEWFPQFDHGGDNEITPLNPIFMQDFWQNADDGDSEEDDKWHNNYVLDYAADNLHSNVSLFNGERKLLESSLFTIIYGLKRIQEHMTANPEFKEKSTWSQILKSTIVLYIGAAGMAAHTHHFNELLKFIPDVHFACYDIRALNTEVPEELKSRITVFHKLFSHEDLQRWISFANFFTNKPIIVISDIRSDWSQAKNEMEAGANVARMKIYMLKGEMNVYPEDSYQYNWTLTESMTRKEIDELFQENRVISEWVDDTVEKDNFVQWMWCYKLQKYSKSCPIFSAKTREPYQTANNIKDVYKHMPGGEFMQTHSLENSTETRTNITNEGFKLSWPKIRNKINNTGQKYTVDIANMSTRDCIVSFFRSFGSPDSFASERINFAKDVPESEPGEAYATLPERNVHLHDKKLTWYNEHRLNNPSADHAIMYMCKAWQEELVRDTVTSSVTPRFNMQDWFKDNDVAIKKKADDNTKRYHRLRNMFNLNEMIRWDDVDRVTIEIKHIRTPKHMSYHFIIDWLKSFSAMKRYEEHILKQTRIWDTSRESLETLLILNINMRLDPTGTTLAINDYTSPYSTDFELLKNGKFILGQLRLNIVNPYACNLYKKVTLQNRYDKILRLVELTRDEDDNHLTFMPGSYSPQVENFIYERLQAQRYTDNPINIGIDWFCYWLQPLLFDIDNSNANNEATVTQIVQATEPFMTWCGSSRGYCLDVYKSDIHSDRKKLDTQIWPMGKPILYHACEKGSLSMLKFCVHGLEKNAMKKKVDTARKRIKLLMNNKTVYEDENFPINTAAFFGHVHIVQHLIEECNANIETTNRWGENPYRSAHWAWNEYRISDPERSASCYACMTFIKEHLEDKQREERHKRLEHDFSREIFISDERKAAYILAHPALSSISKSYTLFIVFEKGVHSFWLQSILDKTDLAYFESLEALIMALQFSYTDTSSV